MAECGDVVFMILREWFDSADIFPYLPMLSVVVLREFSYAQNSCMML